jgi:hypothetical protein
LKSNPSFLPYQMKSNSRLLGERCKCYSATHRAIRVRCKGCWAARGLRVGPAAAAGPTELQASAPSRVTVTAGSAESAPIRVLYTASRTRTREPPSFPGPGLASGPGVGAERPLSCCGACAGGTLSAAGRLAAVAPGQAAAPCGRALWSVRPLPARAAAAAERTRESPRAWA